MGVQRPRVSDLTDINGMLSGIEADDGMSAHGGHSDALEVFEGLSPDPLVG